MSDSETTNCFYPLQADLPITFDPVTTIYLPLALGDECMLYAVLFSTASRIARRFSWKSKDEAEFLQSALQQLNLRLRTGGLSDPTISAVTCLALREVSSY